MQCKANPLHQTPQCHMMETQDFCLFKGCICTVTTVCVVAIMDNVSGQSMDLKKKKEKKSPPCKDFLSAKYFGGLVLFGIRIPNSDSSLIPIASVCAVQECLQWCAVYIAKLFVHHLNHLQPFEDM